MEKLRQRVTELGSGSTKIKSLPVTLPSPQHPTTTVYYAVLKENKIVEDKELETQALLRYVWQLLADLTVKWAKPPWSAGHHEQLLTALEKRK